jgi:N-acetyl-alpha-D-muramate 1-phosphate uridylyltransferase
MVFAAGLGMRMRPLTDTIPKPLIKVAGKPMIDHVLDRFTAFGLGTAVVNVHYLADQIEDHLAARHTPKILISDERGKLLDQGGGIRKALPLLGSTPFFLCNTDAFWLEGPVSNLRRLIESWNPAAMDILLLVASTATSIGVDWPGDFTMDGIGRLQKRGEREVAPFVYAGIGLIKPELFAAETREVFKLAPFFFAAAEQGRLFGQRFDGLWLHVGTPQAIEDAERCVTRSVM